jgi:hypothetical protein
MKSQENCYLWVICQLCLKHYPETHLTVVIIKAQCAFNVYRLDVICNQVDRMFYFKQYITYNHC